MIFAEKQHLRVESSKPDAKTIDEERWDVVESFWFKDFASLSASCSTTEAVKALAVLSSDQDLSLIHI